MQIKLPVNNFGMKCGAYEKSNISPVRLIKSDNEKISFSLTAVFHHNCERNINQQFFLDKNIIIYNLKPTTESTATLKL